MFSIRAFGFSGLGLFAVIVLVVVFAVSGDDDESYSIYKVPPSQTSEVRPPQRPLDLSKTLSFSDMKEINGVIYDTYGLVDKIMDNNVVNPDIQYEIVWGNVIVGILLIETLIAPIYYFGFELFEPIGVKDHNGVPGAVDPRSLQRQ